MPVFEWEETYSVGIQEVDRHHEHLIGLLNGTYQAFVTDTQKTDLKVVIDELIDYATYHFAAEEKLMADVGYLHLKEHLVEHETFIQQVLALSQEHQTCRTALSLELIVFLRDWLLGHIMRCDRGYASVWSGLNKGGATLDLM